MNFRLQLCAPHEGCAGLRAVQPTLLTTPAGFGTASAAASRATHRRYADRAGSTAPPAGSSAAAADVAAAADAAAAVVAVNLTVFEDQEFASAARRLALAMGRDADDPGLLEGYCCAAIGSLGFGRHPHGSPCANRSRMRRDECADPEPQASGMKCWGCWMRRWSAGWISTVRVQPATPGPLSPSLKHAVTRSDWRAHVSVRPRASVSALMPASTSVADAAAPRGRRHLRRPPRLRRAAGPRRGPRAGGAGGCRPGRPRADQGGAPSRPSPVFLRLSFFSCCIQISYALHRSAIRRS